MLESLCENCLLSKLALVNVGIDDYLFEYLCVILENSQNLKEVDLSWCAAKPKHFLNLLFTISENRKLQSLNLSNCILFDYSEIRDTNENDIDLIYRVDEFYN